MVFEDELSLVFYHNIRQQFTTLREDVKVSHEDQDVGGSVVVGYTKKMPSITRGAPPPASMDPVYIANVSVYYALNITIVPVSETDLKEMYKRYLENRGVRFSQICKMTDVFEGSIIRAFR
ncbi:hypothetical protein EDD11_006343 [Mortierella claussenii]|nr:hypothetical protein EDD11_006343 [Mortierella claussenii]